MSTSANVVEFRIVNKTTDKQVGHVRQHLLCKSNWSDLQKYTPVEDHTIQAYGYDEEDEDWEGEVEPLKDFLKKRLRWKTASTVNLQRPYV